MKFRKTLAIPFIALLMINSELMAQKPQLEETVYEKIVSLKFQYPEGKRWTNRNRYSSKGGGAGSGCHAFALLLSDAAFGSAKMRKHRNLDELRVGDMIRLNNDTHTVIVIGIDSTNVILAEGNYGKSIHWGRKITKDQLLKTGNYILTRYAIE